jgi:phage gpG-like protein
MSLEFNVNESEFLGMLDRKREIFQKELSRQVAIAGEKFSSHIQKTQMTGRPGLKVQTGRGRRSWVSKVKSFPTSVLLTIGSTVKYLRIHQFGGIIKPRVKTRLRFQVGKGGSKRTVFAKQVKIPKRLRVFEEFREKGRRLIKTAIRNSLKKMRETT